MERLKLTASFLKLSIRIERSYLLGEPRNPVFDSEELLKLAGIRSGLSWQANLTRGCPILLAANHYGGTGRSSDVYSILETALITRDFFKVLGKNLVWVMEEAPRSPFGFLRKQIIETHGHIGVGKGPAGISEIIRQVTAGKNIGIYPEGKTSKILGSADPRFSTLLDLFYRRKLVYQILPVSVYEDSGIFVIAFHQVIDPEGYKTGKALTKKIMVDIADGLPANLKPDEL